MEKMSKSYDRRETKNIYERSCFYFHEPYEQYMYNFVEWHEKA